MEYMKSQSSKINFQNHNNQTQIIPVLVFISPCYTKVSHDHQASGAEVVRLQQDRAECADTRRTPFTKICRGGFKTLSREIWTLYIIYVYIHMYRYILQCGICFKWFSKFWGSCMSLRKFKNSNMSKHCQSTVKAQILGIMRSHLISSVDDR